MGVWEKFIANVRLRRTIVLMVVIFALYEMRDLLSLILLTFIFTFLVLSITNFIRKYIKIPAALIVTIVYLLIIGALYTGVTIYLPKLFNQTESMVRYVIDFYQKPSFDGNSILEYISSYISTSTLVAQMKNGVTILFKYLTSVGSMGVTFVLSLILSFFFTIEKKRMFSFSRSFLKGPYEWFFQDIYYFAEKFVNTFGIVIETQFIIAIVNTTLTTICLAIMNMPQLFSLSLLIFLMSLIPVAGVIISAIPMSIIGYSVGGLNYIVYIVIMLLVIHILESYVLNPKLMSSKTELPIFYTFIVLFVAEKFFGMWGLIVGIPIFTFLLDILGVKPIKRKKASLGKLKEKLSNKE
ncbi:AI-2E family transporter [Liquorilactobacillus cacaonum]|uniref:AI-2E family transporter n=1 Tax=Liquorilactobacillus cacaonum TaxID=483012 RepID=UPI00070FAACF|nr:AI-2E family transporter [Liquorilactobacillus cacaonum]